MSLVFGAYHFNYFDFKSEVLEDKCWVILDIWHRVIMIKINQKNAGIRILVVKGITQMGDPEHLGT